MTRRHFEIVASVLQSHLAHCNKQADKAQTSTQDGWKEREKALQAVAASFAAEFASVNPHFKPTLFLRACQPEVSEG